MIKSEKTKNASIISLDSSTIEGLILMVAGIISNSTPIAIFGLALYFTK